MKQEIVDTRLFLVLATAGVLFSVGVVSASDIAPGQHQQPQRFSVTNQLSGTNTAVKKRTTTVSSPELSSSSSSSSIQSQPLSASTNHNILRSNSPQSSKNTVPTNNLIREFINDVHQISSLQPQSNLTKPCFLVSRDSSYTKSWTNRDWEIHCTRPLKRYARHMKMWKSSSTAKAVLPTVLLLVSWSVVVSALYTQNDLVAAFLTKSKLSTSLIATLGSPIALLLTLRTNRSLDRVLDARKAYGQVNRSSRSLMGLVCAYVLPFSPRKALLVARYLALMGWAIKSWLREEDDTFLINFILPPEEAHWLLSTSGKVVRPIAILTRLREICSTLIITATTTTGEIDMNKDRNHHGHNPINAMAHLEMEKRIYDLETSVGVMTRILGSPIPPTYTRHTSRVLCLYLCFLPLALIGSGVSPIALVITVALTSYVLIGIDEMGLEMEHPFPIFPMQALATTMQKNIVDQVEITKSMPKLD